MAVDLNEAISQKPIIPMFFKIMHVIDMEVIISGFTVGD